MRWICCLVVLPLWLGEHAMAEGVAVPMLTVPDLQTSASPSVFEGVEGGSAGAIYFPDTILSFSVESAEGDGQKIIDQWSKSHRFIIMPIKISVAPKDGFIPEAVDVTASFSGIGQLKQQPIVIDSFPATGFNPSAFQGDASLKLNGEAKFAPVPTGTPVSAGAGAEGTVGLSYKYAPAYANVVSGFASGHAFWQFHRTQEKYPIGEIPMKLLVAVPKSYAKPALIITFDVKARFSGSWWKNGLTMATFVSSVTLPDGKK